MRLLRPHPRLTIHFSTTAVLGHGPKKRSIVATLKTSSGGKVLHLGAVLSAVGFGTERCTAGGFRGWYFWDTDTIEKTNLGASAPPSVVLSGGGDGALQDCLRAVTGKRSAKEILRALPIPESVLGALGTSEEQASRAYALSTGLKEEDHEILERLHHRHVDLAKTALNRNPRLESACDGMLRKDVSRVQLIFRCTHFGKSYALNRFLVLLLAERVASQPFPVLVLKEGTEVQDVLPPMGHMCGSPNACVGEKHSVVTVPYPDCRGTPGTGASTIPDVEVLVLRHGLVATPPHQSRQLLPFHASM
jgi:hypothetical protein